MGLPDSKTTNPLQEPGFTSPAWQYLLANVRSEHGFIINLDDFITMLCYVITLRRSDILTLWHYDILML